MAYRTSQSVPTVPETPVIPFPGTEQREPRPFQTVNRVATIEPGIGCFRIVYRDEYGSPLLEWECDYRVSDENRQWLRKVQQAVGDDLVTLRSARPVLRLTPR